MATLTNAQLLTKYNDSGTGLFKDQTNREIVPNRPRSLVTDLTDSFFNKLNDAYTGAKGQYAGVTAPASLKDIVTTSLPFGAMITFTDSTASNVVRIYELTNETTAESSPTVIRPNDYATTTNEKVWRLRVTADVDSDTGGGGGASDWGDLGGTITDQTDLVTYVDTQIGAAIAGLKWKNPARAATTTAGTLATDYEDGDTVDGVTLATGDRIVLKNQASQTENGIYTVNASGAPTRATDADTGVELEGATLSILEGTTNANTTWVQTTDNITLGSSNIIFTQFGSSVVDADATTKGIARLYPSTSLGTNTDGAPTQNAVKSYADSRITQVITNGVTTTAPSEDAVFDALALKADLTAVIGVFDVWVSAAAMWPRTTGGCQLLTQSEMATSIFNIQTLDFDQTTQEFCQFQVVLPRRWNLGTVTAEVYWTASTGSGGVVFGLSGGAYSNDDALTVAFGTAQTMTDTLIVTNDLHISPTSSAITLAGTPADADFLGFQLSRNPSDGSDTLTGDAKVLGIMIHITTDAAKDA